MADASPSAAPGPYAVAAPLYWQAGFRGVLPLPAGAKTPVPRGFTGRDGAWPSFPDVQAWTEDRGAGNVALRLPPDVLGVDVDHYGNKPGGAVLADLERRLGELPPTWRSTSRDDGVSGIRLYRIPAGLRWPGILGPGIETIRYEHRYAVAWPSIHPGDKDTPPGATYRWITASGATALGQVPQVDELPELPGAWVEHFTHGEVANEQPRAGLSEGDAASWVASRDSGVAPACRRIAAALSSGLAELVSGGSRHDAALTLTNRLAWLIGEGHVGGPDALSKARAAFLSAVSAERGVEDAMAEWERMVTGAVDLAAAAHPSPSPDPCLDPFAGLIPKDTSSTPVSAPTSSSSPATSPVSPSPSSASPPPSTPSTSEAPVSLSASTPTTTGATADDLTELQILRNQAAAAEVERLRAQRTALRTLELEDEEDVVGDRVRRRLLDDKASLAYRLATEPAAPPFDAGTLTEILARPEDPPMRVAGLIPWEASTLVVAQRKTGKTTLVLNYARALLTGEAFLGEFETIALPEGARVAMLNYEVSGATLGRWAHDIGVPADRLVLVNLRGRRNPLGHPEDRAALAGMLRELDVQSVIVDPFGRAYSGASQNDNGEVQAWLVDLDMFVRAEVGALDLMLATHAGWDGERTRGASALEDWPDAIVTLTQGEDGRRFMRAMGRDVDVEEDELVLDPLSRSLTRSGNGGRRATKPKLEKVYRVMDAAVAIVAGSPGCSRGDVQRALEADPELGWMPKGGRRNDLITDALKEAERKGLIVCVVGAKGYPNAYSPAPTTPTTPNYSPGGPENTHSLLPPPYRGSSGGAGASVAGRRTPIAGGALAYDHDSGRVVNTETGELVEEA